MTTPVSHSDSSDLRAECWTALQNKSAEHEEKYKGGDIWKTPTLYFLVDARSGSGVDSIVYAVRHKTVHFSEKQIPSGKAARQVLIKRFSNGVPSSAVIAEYVFWKKIFPRYGIVVSDSIQSQDGRSFWLRQINKAFEDGMRVTLLDTNDQSKKSYSSYEEFANDTDKIWQAKPWFQRKIIAISKEEI